MNKVYLALEEAQDLIPYIRKDVERLIKLNKAILIINSLEVEFDDDFEELTYNLNINKNYHKLSYEMFDLLNELHKKGCMVKDLDKGYINFYSFFENREILLCWNASEEKINYWHETCVGCESRKPISMIQFNLKNK
ncbi:MAG: DUF2203 family protein [archaeon]